MHRPLRALRASGSMIVRKSLFPRGCPFVMKGLPVGFVLLALSGALPVAAAAPSAKPALITHLCKVTIIQPDPSIKNAGHHLQ